MPGVRRESSVVSHPRSNKFAHFDGGVLSPNGHLCRKNKAEYVDGNGSPAAGCGKAARTASGDRWRPTVSGAERTEPICSSARLLRRGRVLPIPCGLCEDRRRKTHSLTDEGKRALLIPGPTALRAGHYQVDEVLQFTIRGSTATSTLYRNTSLPRIRNVWAASRNLFENGPSFTVEEMLDLQAKWYCQLTARSVCNSHHPNKIRMWTAASEALRLPFVHFGLFLRLAAVPAAITAALGFGAGPLVRLIGQSAALALLLLTLTVVPVPLWVAWTRFTVLGNTGVDHYSWFTFGTREMKFVAAQVAMMLAYLGPAAICVYISYALYWSVPSLVLAAVIGIAEIVVGIRLVFILPAIAVDGFRGLRAAWDQTRSTVLRILGAVALAGLPIFFVQSIVYYAQQSAQLPILVVLSLAHMLLFFLSLIVWAGVIAICYSLRGDLQDVAVSLRVTAAAVKPVP
jgi:hypothetical protein